MSVKVKADDSIIDKVNIRVPVSCTLTGVGMNSHTAEIQNGTYNSAIGETTLKAFCNDTAGFAIYAIGYTDEEDGKNVLTNASLGSTYDITTGTATSGNDSKWAMKLSVVSSPTPTYPITIQNSFDSFHQVPDDYTLVAKRTGGTDTGTNAEGSTLKTTYQVYISSEQPAGTYTGKVKYTLVHPNDIPTPKSTMLDTGQVVGAKMKTLAAGTETAYNASTSDIKAIRMADELPAGFTPTEANTVSTSTSRHPIYIFYDNTNDAGIMYFYAGEYQVVMNPDSSQTFRSNSALSDISGLATWDASNVTTLRSFFYNDTGLADISALANWDVSNVTSLHAAFYNNTSLADISALANWDVKNVTTLYGIFAGNSSLTDISPLANWDTSNVTTLQATFYGDTSLTDISALANWDVGNVTDLSFVFGSDSSLTDISALANWDTSNVTTMVSTFNNTFKLTDFSPLANWKTSKVENMGMTFGMGPGKSKTGDPIIDLTPLANWDVSNVTSMQTLFQNTNIASFLPLQNWDVGKVQDFTSTFNQTNKSTTTTLAGLENWNVSSATNMSNMFADSVSLTDASAINGWDVRNVVIGTGAESATEGFNQMFGNTPVHPTFTLRAGTWNSNGTFIPSS